MNFNGKRAFPARGGLCSITAEGELPSERRVALPHGGGLCPIERSSTQTIDCLVFCSTGKFKDDFTHIGERLAPACILCAHDDGGFAFGK